MQEVSVLSGDQLMYKSMICEPPETPPEQKLSAPKSANATASAGILMGGGAGTYKVPEASNNWKAEVKVCKINYFFVAYLLDATHTIMQRIWNKPVEQLPIGIDLPRLATSIFVPSIPATPVVAPAAEPAATPAVDSAATPVVAPTDESATPAVDSAATPAAEDAVTPAGADGDVNMTEATQPAAAEAPAPVPTPTPTPAPAEGKYLFIHWCTYFQILTF